MTINDIAKMLNIHRTTVYRVAKQLYPENFKNGSKTIFSEDEAIEIVSNLRKKGFITPLQNAKEPLQNAKLDVLLEKVTNLIDLVLEQNKTLFHLVKNLSTNKLIENKNNSYQKNENGFNIDDLLENSKDYEWFYINSISKYFNCDKNIIYKALLEKGIIYYSDYTAKYEFRDYYIENDLVRFYNKIPLLRRQLVDEIKPVVDKLIKKEKKLF